MKINACKFLATLRLLDLAISKKPITKQSDCVIFQDGKIFAFSGEVFAILHCDTEFSGAVSFELLSSVLGTYGNSGIEMLPAEDSSTRLRIKCGRSRTTLAVDPLIVLSVSAISYPNPANWISLPDEFVEGMSLCDKVAKTDQADDVISSVNVDLETMEAASPAKLLRYRWKSPFAFRFLVRGGIVSSLIEKLKKTASSEDQVQMQLTEGWLFLRNDLVTYALPIFLDEFLDLDPYLVPGEQEVEFPKDVVKELALCKLFVGGGFGDKAYIRVELDSASSLCKLTAVKSGGFASGSHFAEIPMETPIDASFDIAPVLFQQVIEDYGKCSITSSALRVETDKVSYSVAIN